MDFERHQNDLRVQRRANRTLGGIVVLLSLCLLLSLGVIAGIVGSERTVIVPPSIDKTFWVTRDKASAEYLEQMAGFMTWLVLDVSPSTIDWKRNVLLNYVAPDRHAAMKTQMDLEADRLRSTANDKDQSVLVLGRLRRQINGADVGEPETRAYLTQFQYTGGRVHVKTFKEIPYGQAGQTRISTADSHAVVR
jgi:conjugal transfer pilus assembly protein TraE